MESWLFRARRASGLSVDECAKHLCLSRDSYLELELTPGKLRLNEVFALQSLFNEEGNGILWDALLDLKPLGV